MPSGTFLFATFISFEYLCKIFISMTATKYRRIKDDKLFILEWLWKLGDKHIAAFIGTDNRETIAVKEVINSDKFELVSGNKDTLIAFNPDTRQLSPCCN